jgi:hypothetical protein
LGKWQEQDVTMEETIREKSYFMWLDEGCPHGRAMDHWLRAEAELQHKEHNDPFDCSNDYRHYVAPRPPISRRPRLTVSALINHEVPGTVAPVMPFRREDQPAEKF